MLASARIRSQEDGMHRPRPRIISARRLACAWVVALLACAPAFAQQGEPIGSWWFLEISGAPAPRHAIMTLSTQGSGVIAFQCAAGRPTVILGLTELRPRSGATVALDFDKGGRRQRAEAVRTSEDTVELDERASAAIIAEAADAASFSVHLPQAEEAEVALVFRPVETKRAVERLNDACAERAPPR
jgi:hypothetical protein